MGNLELTAECSGFLAWARHSLRPDLSAEQAAVIDDHGRLERRLRFVRHARRTSKISCSPCVAPTQRISGSHMVAFRKIFIVAPDQLVCHQEDPREAMGESA